MFPDFKELWQSFHAHGVEYLIVGAMLCAVIPFATPRHEGHLKADRNEQLERDWHEATNIMWAHFHLHGGSKTNVTTPKRRLVRPRDQCKV